MAFSEAGISTLGVKVGYAVETTKGTKPTKFIWLQRANGVDEFTLEPETIDASALEDTIARSVAGRSSTPGSFNVTFNLTNETLEMLEQLITDYNGLTGSKQMWLEIYNPKMTKAVYFCVQPPQALPSPAREQNGLETIAVAFTVTDYKGWDTAIEPTEPVSGS